MLIESSKEMMTWALKDKQEFLEQKGRKRSKRKLDMRKKQSGQSWQKSEDEGTESSSWDGKAAQQSRDMGREGGGQRRGSGTDYENTLNAMLKNLDFSEVGVP